MCSVLFFVDTEINAQIQQADKDFYAALAAHGQIADMNRPMETPSPVTLPTDKELSWASCNTYRFPSSNKISNVDEVKTELSKLKKQYEPFLRDLTVPFQEVRKRIPISKMDFRYENSKDCADFNRLLEGEGEWQEVAIPYYHGPQGISTAWYRTEVNIPADFFKLPVIMLHFNGADYYTDAYINGHHVGFHEGMLDEFEFNIKKYARPGKNVILVKLRNDYSMLGGEGKIRYWGNKLAASNSPGWDDPYSGWTCCPAGYGLYQDVYIESRSEPYISDVFCRPLIDESAVELWVELDLENGRKADDFLLKLNLFGQNFDAHILVDSLKPIRVEGGRVLNKTMIKIPKSQLKLWNPESPWLYQMRVSLYDKTGTQLLDNKKQQFGMRHFEISEKSNPKGRFFLNNKEVRLRGTNTMGFLQKDVMAHNWNQLVDDLLLTKLTNMNFIRTTQRIVQKEVYEYADKLGMMMQADLPLFAYVNQKQYTQIITQAGNIERVLRNHPSVIVMSYINEPMADVQAHAISRYAYENLFEALNVVIHNENPERAVKYIDGDYQAPSNGYPDNHCYNIWYDGHGVDLDVMSRGGWMPISKGWMFGCGEFGAEGLDHESLINRCYPPEWKRKEADGTWSPKYMETEFSTSQTYKMHWNWFETQHTLKDWIRESQAHQAWGIEMVSKSFRRMSRMNSFAVHLFIDAWPNGWMKAIMDCERNPKPAWYAYRDALTPLSVQVVCERLRCFTGDKVPFQVWICNDTHLSPTTTLKYTLEVDGRVVNSGYSKAVVPSIKEGSAFQGFLNVDMPKVHHRSKVKVRVGLFDENGTMLHEDEAVCDVFPQEKARNHVSIRLLGRDCDANALIDAFKISKIQEKGKINNQELVLVSDSVAMVSHIGELKQAVEQGARVLVLKNAISGIDKVLDNVSVNPVDTTNWILFRNTEHPWIKGSKVNDLKYTYSSKYQTPRRYHFREMTAPECTPVLTFHNSIVLGEIKKGKGKWIICSLELEGLLDTTPLLAHIIGQILDDK